MDFTLEDAFALVKANKAFYHRRHEVHGYRADLFNYHDIAGEADFNSDLALEMRGLCFLDGRRCLALKKFFNLNQVSTTRYEVLRRRPVAEVADKLDGSLIRFLRVGEHVVAKTKMSFNAVMAERANALYAGDAALQKLVLHTLDAGLAAHFEFVAPQHPIILVYEKERLVLLSVRDEASGEVVSASEFAHFGVPLAQTFSFEEGVPVLEDLMARCEKETGKEGYVVRFTDGHMVKLKTSWYFMHHGKKTETVHQKVYRADCLVGLVLDGTVDDMLGQLGDDAAARDVVLNAQAAVSHALTSAVDEIKSMVACYRGDRKAFFLEFGKWEWFECAARCLDAMDEEMMDAAKGRYRKMFAKQRDAERLLPRLLAKAGLAAEAGSAAPAAAHTLASSDVPADVGELSLDLRYYILLRAAGVVSGFERAL